MTFPVAAAGQERLCVGLMEMLHAAAQPLTIMQGRTDALFVDQMEPDELRGALHDAAKEAERLRVLFGYMQELVAAESAKPSLWAQPLAPALERVAEGLETFLAETGVRLKVGVGAGLEMVFADRSRLEQALSRVVLVAYGLSLPSDTIEMMADVTPTGARIVVRHERARGGLKTEAKMKLALAEASVRSQRGELVWTTDPFSVELRLRKAPSVGQVLA